MQEIFTSLGLMSGTSGDGVDASIVSSDGISQFEVIKNKYYEYDTEIYKAIHHLKEKISNKNDLNRLSNQLKDLERKITLFHAKIINDLKLKNTDVLIGFHGQTIYHNSYEKISKQLGDGKLLNQLTNKKIVFNFRKKDMENGGEGAPLTPIFHQLLASLYKISLPVCILNIGGISNITIINKSIGSTDLHSKDLGPGNCLIDSWVRKNSNQKFDDSGKLAALGKRNDIIFEQAQELYINRNNKNKLSFDVNDFDISFSRGLSLEDGAATLTDFTASIIADSLSEELAKHEAVKEILICGGGRKNKILLKTIKNIFNSKLDLKSIDEYGINGDFIESQAFGFLAVRTIKCLPITFPKTTNCLKPSSGGEIIDN